MTKISPQLIKELLHKPPRTGEALSRLKRSLAKKFNCPLPTNAELIAALSRNSANQPLLFLLKKRAVRTSSGIAPIAILTKAFPCPGRCAYCPTDKNIPQSYLANEPAVMRAVRCDFHPYTQVSYRLRALEANGHQPTKIELIIIGGTWSALPTAYQYWFIAEAFRAANDYDTKNKSNVCEHLSRPTELPMDNESESGSKNINLLKTALLKEQKKNEKAKYRIIGLTLETRPDRINEQELWRMRELGATRVELGVQALDDKILKLNRRDSTVADIARATKLLKNFGFKITYHFMPALPGSTARRDWQMFREMFSPDEQSPIIEFKKNNATSFNQLLDQELTNNDFNPDQLKFYPTVVTEGSLLYKWWQDGKYRPYSDKTLKKLIIDCKKIVPPFTRIIRLIRDIPGESIIAGNKITNLRQIIKNEGVICRCIRCREVGQKPFKLSDTHLFVQKYRASDSDEYFISFNSRDQKTLYGFARLRLPADKGVFKHCALLRELHVYGQLVGIGETTDKTQHRGLGKRLIATAEAIARAAGYRRLAVISGVGVRGYYKKLGYKLSKSYMIKGL